MGLMGSVLLVLKQYLRWLCFRAKLETVYFVAFKSVLLETENLEVSRSWPDPWTQS